MPISGVIAQLRTTDLAASVRFYTERLGFVAATAQALKDNGVPFVEDVHDTPWQTRAFIIHDDQGHTVYFSEALPAAASD